jgi:hypothetical protein
VEGSLNSPAGIVRKRGEKMTRREQLVAFSNTASDNGREADAEMFYGMALCIDQGIPESEWANALARQKTSLGEALKTIPEFLERAWEEVIHTHPELKK